MNEFIEGFFALCCLVINGIGELFNFSYEAINVYAFCYVEPIFTASMLLFVVLSIFLPIQKIGIWFFRIIVCFVGIFLIIGLGYAIRDVVNVLSNNSDIYSIINTTENDPYIMLKFDHTVDWLSKYAQRYNISYYAINLIVYVIIMPLVCIFSYFNLKLINRIKKSKC